MSSCPKEEKGQITRDGLAEPLVNDSFAHNNGLVLSLELLISAKG